MFTGSEPDVQKVEQTLGHLLEHHEKLSGIERKKKTLNRLSSNYDVNALHTDVPATNLLKGLRNLTPGDFQTVYERHITAPLSPSEAVAALKTESSCKRNGLRSPIGFH